MTKRLQNRTPRLGLIIPTDAEDAEIQRGIEQDPDNPEWTEADFANARPAREVMPEMRAGLPRVPTMREVVKRLRGPQKAVTKELISVRLDRDLLDALRGTGAGWQGRMNAALRRRFVKSS